MDLVAAAESGDRRAALEALRDRLARAMEGVADVKALAPLANQLRLVLAEIDQLPGSKGVSVVDDLAARRADRRSTATSGDVPEGGGVVGS